MKIRSSKINQKLINPHIVLSTGLIKQLWEKSLKPEHFVGGFRATGLFPLSREAISNSKLATSIPFQQSKETEHTECTVSLPQLTCTDCKRCVTPVKLHVVAYITRQIQAKPKPRSTDNRRVKPTVYGEVLTSDEVVERLEEKEREKTKKAAEKERKAAEKASKKAKGAKSTGTTKKRKGAPAKKKEIEKANQSESESDIGTQLVITRNNKEFDIFFPSQQMRKFVSGVEEGTKMMMKQYRQGG